MVARLLWEQKAAGSSPAAPTSSMFEFNPSRKLVCRERIEGEKGYEPQKEKKRRDLWFGWLKIRFLF